MDDSPSKGLVEELQSFHISSPNSKQNGSHVVKGQFNVKKYLPNNDFADSRFLSYMGDSNSKSYIKKLGDWSMNYGTVQQKPKQNLHTNQDLGHSFASEQNNVGNNENIELPQFKHYLQTSVQKQNGNQRSNEQILKSRESDLILTASLNDISGIPTNTFKRHNNNNNNNNNNNKKLPMTYPESGSVIVNGKSNDENGFHARNASDEEDDIDPALEARGVFDNILKNQKSNYEFHRGNPLSMQTVKLQEKYMSDTASSSYLGETPSSLSPNIDALQDERQPSENSKTSHVERLGLIKPEDVGLVFNNVDGVWYKPAPKTQDISSSRTTDNTFGNHIDSANSTDTITENVSAVTDSKMTDIQSKTRPRNKSEHLIVGKPELQDHLDTGMNVPLLRNKKNKVSVSDLCHGNSPKPSESTSDSVSDADDYELDDTPLDVPQINPKFMPRHENYTKTAGNDKTQTINSEADVDTVNKRHLVKILTDIIPQLQSDWSQITSLNLSHRHLRQLNGLDQILPKLIDLDLSGNDLVDFSGIPASVMTLNLSNNKITTNYSTKHLPRLLHLQSLNLSKNALAYNLSFLSSLCHLIEVDLSFNQISSISDDLGFSRITKLNMSHNSIKGVLDFEKILKYNSNVYCSNSVCWLTVQELDLSDNQITGLKNVSMLRNLKKLILDHNPISIIADKNPNTALETLSLINIQTTLIDFDVSQFKNLRNLKLDLHHNIVDTWNESTLPADLEDLHIQNGTAADLPPFSVLPISLKRLTINNVRGLRSLPRDLPERVPLLKMLDVTGNEMASWYRIVECIPTLQLQELVLVSNPLVIGLTSAEIRRIEEVIYSICPKMARIAMYDTPLSQTGPPPEKWRFGISSAHRNV